MSRLRDALGNLPGAVFADLLESDEAYLLVMDLPGVSSETVDVEVVNNRLTIEGRREKDVPEGFRYAREERSVFLDVDLPLPPDARQDGASARIESGVLEVRLPKAAATARDIPLEE
jgi:HSP20 family molecular chaperone IbpA